MHKELKKLRKIRNAEILEAVKTTVTSASGYDKFKSITVIEEALNRLRDVEDTLKSIKRELGPIGMSKQGDVYFRDLKGEFKTASAALSKVDKQLKQK